MAACDRCNYVHDEEECSIVSDEPNPWLDEPADDALLDAFRRAALDVVPTPRQLRDAANGPWQEK